MTVFLSLGRGNGSLAERKAENDLCFVAMSTAAKPVPVKFARSNAAAMPPPASLKLYQEMLRCKAPQSQRPLQLMLKA
jgi:hypothetical protein